MALAAATIWEINAGGSDSANGGGFDPSNTNMATDLAATSATGTAPVVTSASYNFVTRDNGAWIFIKAGTNWTPGWYKIASTAGNAATLDAAVGHAFLMASNVPYTANATAGCATTASPTGGTWTIDYSQGTAPGIAYTDMVIDGTTNTKYTSSGNAVGPNVVGNIISVTSGTGFTVQRVQISSVSGTTATCDKSLGTLSSTGGNGGLGGALASPGQASGLVTGTTTNPSLIAIRNTGSPTVYTFSNSANVSGGRIAASVPCHIFGYATNRYLQNSDTRPQCKPSVNSTTMFYGSGGGMYYRNLDITNPSGTFTGCTGFLLEAMAITENCKVGNMAHAYNCDFGVGVVLNCQADACVASCELSSTSYCFGFTAINSAASSGSAITLTGGARINWFIVSGGTGSGITVSTGCGAANGVVYGLTGVSGNGIIVNANLANPSEVFNCVVSTCSQNGFTGGSAYGQYARLFNCASYNNLSDYDSNIHADNLINFHHLTADPFTNAAAGDFSPNTTAGGGAVLRAAGFPTSFPGLSTNSYGDIGAAQSQAAPSGFPTRARVFTGM